MCYDAAQLAYRIYQDAVRMKASPEEVEELRIKWERLKEGYTNHYHISGFDHPDMVIFEKIEDRLDIRKAIWGLIPSWARDQEHAMKLWNSTIIARGESIFEKPSFREAAEKHRCIIPIDGFYEHYHKNGKTFPYYIQRKDGKRMLVAAIKSEWKTDLMKEPVESFAIITTKANQLMSEIHNNPKVSESRMPLLLDDEQAQTWFNGNKEEIESLIQPNQTQKLVVKTVKPLRGKNYLGNIAEIQQEHEYDELSDNPGQRSLF